MTDGTGKGTKASEGPEAKNEINPTTSTTTDTTIKSTPIRRVNDLVPTKTDPEMAITATDAHVKISIFNLLVPYIFFIISRFRTRMDLPACDRCTNDLGEMKDNQMGFSSSCSRVCPFLSMSQSRYVCSTI